MSRKLIMSKMKKNIMFLRYNEPYNIAANPTIISVKFKDVPKIVIMSNYFHLELKKKKNEDKRKERNFYLIHINKKIKII